MARKQARKAKAPQEPLVNAFAASHGMYAKDSDDDREKEGKSTLTRNRHVDPVERWKSYGLLSETQVSAIDYCQNLWEKVGTSRPIVADYLRVPGMPGGDGLAEQYALSELHDLKREFPLQYWDVWESVCRHGEPGGVAGSRWVEDNKRASQSALMCIRFVGDLIAMKRRL